MGRDRWTRLWNWTIVGARQRETGIEKKGDQMGDKGGKKDKAKDQKQKVVRQEQESKKKLDKQPKRKP